MSLPAKKAIEIDKNITHYIYKMLNHEMILKSFRGLAFYDEPLKKDSNRNARRNEGRI